MPHYYRKREHRITADLQADCQRTHAEQAKHILGMGCQMWGKWIPKVTEMYRQVYPRIAAYAEDGWTDDSNKNFSRFKKALGKLKHYWDNKGISYYDEK